MPKKNEKERKKTKKNPLEVECEPICTFANKECQKVYN